MGQAFLAQPSREHPSGNLGEAWNDAMQAGDFAAAWRISDAVLAAANPAGRDDPRRAYHERWVWDGRPVEGREVLVRCYHGLGDTIQFARYLPALSRRAARVTVEAPPALIPLLSTIDGPSRWLPFRPAAPLPPAECDVEIMELAHVLRLRPDPAPYLAVPPEPLPPGPTHVGVCWSVTTGWKPTRSVPPALLGGLGEGRAVVLHSLQPGAVLPGMTGRACPSTLDGTARLIAGLDLVVTIDGMVAHLAGALGTDVCLLLEARPDWRWRAGGRSSPWYDAVRTYRQTSPGDWTGPLRALTADLYDRAHAETLLVRPA